MTSDNTWVRDALQPFRNKAGLLSHDGVTPAQDTAPVPGELRIDLNLEIWPFRMYTVVAVYHGHCLILETSLWTDHRDGPVLKTMARGRLMMISRSWWSPRKGDHQ